VYAYACACATRHAKLFAAMGLEFIQVKSDTYIRCVFELYITRSRDRASLIRSEVAVTRMNLSLFRKEQRTRIFIEIFPSSIISVFARSFIPRESGKKKRSSKRITGDTNVLAIQRVFNFIKFY